MKILKRFVAAILVAAVSFAGTHFALSAYTGTNSTQAQLFDSFPDAGPPVPIAQSLRNLVASVVTLQDTQTITGAKTFTSLTATTLNATTLNGTGGSVTGSNLPYTLAESGIPLIGLSSGTMSSAGALSAFTALPLVYPSAYCYMPANAVATTITAGWYYCTFSGTTAGTVFLNQWDPTTGLAPTIPTSPTAVTTGSSWTGDTGEEFGPQIALAANSLGKAGQLEWAFNANNTSNANAKTFRGRWTGTTGTILFNPNGASNPQFGHTYVTANAGATNSQGTAGIGGSPVTISVPTISAIDSTASTTLVLSMQRATATDNAILTFWRIRVAFGS